MTEQDIEAKRKALQAEREELEPYFNQVCNKGDWKDPIDAFCRRSDASNVTRAITFFTATSATLLEPVPPCADWIRVQSEGYRRGPAGDH